jgi:multiple sugar transport system ATP-binding protein
MVAGLEDVSAGTISIGGRVVNDVPPKDRDVAMVFRSYALNPHMTVSALHLFDAKTGARLAAGAP